MNYSRARQHPAWPVIFLFGWPTQFTISKPRNRSFYEVRKRRSTDFEALKLWKRSVGFHYFWSCCCLPPLIFNNKFSGGGSSSSSSSKTLVVETIPTSVIIFPLPGFYGFILFSVPPPFSPRKLLPRIQLETMRETLVPSWYPQRTKKKHAASLVGLPNYSPLWHSYYQQLQSGKSPLKPQMEIGAHCKTSQLQLSTFCSYLTTTHLH